MKMRNMAGKIMQMNKMLKADRNIRKANTKSILSTFLGIFGAFFQSIFFSLSNFYYGMIGCILGPIYFILVKAYLPYIIFGNIFYCLGGLCGICLISLIIFDKKNIGIIACFIGIIIIIINLIIGYFLFMKKGKRYLIMNLLFASINGGTIGIFISHLFYKFKKSENISETQFDKLKKYNSTPINAGNGNNDNFKNNFGGAKFD